MELPGHLIHNRPRILDKLSTLGNPIKYDHVIKWLLQFDPEDQSLALELFFSINYIRHSDLQDLCRGIYAKLPPLTEDQPRGRKYLGLGDAGTSGQMALYHFRLANRIAEEECADYGELPHIINTERIDTIVLVDDFVGSGNQAVDEWHEDLSEFLEGHPNVVLYYVAIAGFKSGADYIEENTPLRVRLGLPLTNKDKVFDEACPFLLSDPWERDRQKQRMSQRYDHLFPGHPLGYKNSQSLVVFYYNVPNNSLPVIWSKSNWIPLFERFDTPKPPRIARTAISERKRALPPVGYDALVSRATPPSVPVASKATILGTLFHDLESIKDARRYRAKLRRLTANQVKVLAFLAVTQTPLAIGRIRRLTALEWQEVIDAIQSLAQRSMLQAVHVDYATRYAVSPGMRTPALALLKSSEALLDEVFLRMGTELLGTLDLYENRDMERYAFFAEQQQTFLNAIEWAFRRSQWDLALKLRRPISWFLLQKSELHTRIQLGERALEAARQLGDEVSEGWILIDDLGWTYAALGAHKKARENIEEGVLKLGWGRERRGYCKGWRHLAGIDILQRELSRPGIMLPLLFGLAKQIPSNRHRIEMQAGILKGTGHWADKAQMREIALRCFQRAVTLYRSVQDEYRALKIEQLAADLVRNNEANSNGYGSVETPHPFRLILARHTESDKTASARFGRMGENLPTQNGMKANQTVVSALREHLGDIPLREPTVVISGPAEASRVLGHELASHFGVPFVEDKSFDSIDTGLLSGLTEKEATEKFPEAMNLLTSFRMGQLDGYSVVFPEGEPVSDFEFRIANGLLGLVYKKWPIGSLILIGHRSTLTAILNLANSLNRKHEGFLYRYYDIMPGCIYQLAFGGSSIVEITRVFEGIEG